MKNVALSPGNIDDIKGVTLEERAKLVLLTLGKTPADIRRAYRRLANRYHPDKPGGDTERFQVLGEAYALLTQGVVPRRPMLADDSLIVRLIGRRVEPLIDRQKEWEEYMRWNRKQFYWDW
ncbi:MAG: DnaJ domain-containing protein [Lentisphaerae bacterium]|nr:DnaJ domain-containing protein [Lentisphaerota bacterium]